nr:hypothetical protein [Tanacetum cinerariifolium]
MWQRVVTSRVVGLIDRETENVFGVRQKSSPEKFSGGGGSGGGGVVGGEAVTMVEVVLAVRDDSHGGGGDGGGMGQRVVTSRVVGLIDRETGNVFGVRQKSSPEKFSGGGGSGGGGGGQT